MDPDRIAELLQPFLGAKALPAPAALALDQLQSISIYIDLLQRWNARINLTAVRDAESIVTRHFGESLFLAAYLFSNVAPSEMASQRGLHPQHALDFGSGAGFPGLPLKIYSPELRLTLVESNHKKAAFLWEVIRALHLTDAFVFGGRLEARVIEGAESGSDPGVDSPGLVTLRAVERFDSALATAAALVRYAAARLGAGRLALLIGDTQAEKTRQFVHDFEWKEPIPVPESRERVLLVGRYVVRYVTENQRVVR